MKQFLQIMFSKYRFFSLLLLMTTMGVAQNTQDATEILVNKIIIELLKLPNTPPGMSLAVSKNDKVVFASGYGFQDIETKKPVSPFTKFRAASVSKVITVTALSRLLQKGKVQLNDKVGSYVPEYTSKNRNSFTIGQLAGHLSGIPHYSEEDKLEKKFYNTVQEALNVFQHRGLLSKPGARYEYSTHGYTLLSRVIENVTNKDFLDYLGQEVLEPLAMNSTGPHLIQKPEMNMTRLYDFYRKGDNKGLPFKIGNPEDISYKWAGGGMISTPTDLVKMANGYLNGFIESKIVKRVFGSLKLNSGKKTGVGIGWRNNWDMGDRRVVEHAGGMEGARSVISIFPDHDVAIALMGNAQRLWVIEETVHMLALPFLTSPSPQKQPRGSFDVSLVINYNGKRDTVKSRIILNGKNDRLILDSDSENKKIYSLIYMQRDNVYALIHPHGVLYTTIVKCGEKGIKGKTMYYKSPNTEKPSQQNPIFYFEEIFD